jgi:hypothetical protein
MATVTALAGVAVATLVPWPALAVAGFALAGLGAAVLFPRIYDEAAQAARPGAMLGAMAAGIRVSAFTVPVAIGYLGSTDALPVGAAMALVIFPAGACILAVSDRGQRRGGTR